MQSEKEWFCLRIQENSRCMYSLAYGLLKNSADAEDAVAEAVCKAYASLASLKNRDRFKPWIMRITSNTAYDMIRGRRYEDLGDEAADTPSPPEGIDAVTGISLWDAVCSLPLPYRTVLILYYYDGLSVKEVAEATGVSRDTAKKQLSRAREKLRVILPPDFARRV